MSVVRRDAQRRWVVVGAGITLLVGLPTLAGALPVADVDSTPTELRDRVLASSAQPYQGLAESRGLLGLPDIPRVDTVTALLGGTTRIRAWYSTPVEWRVDVLSATGEEGLYRDRRGTWAWSFERNTVVRVGAEPPARLPRAADLLPPELARRLLRTAGPDDTLTPLEPRRVAGRATAGFRLTPAEAGTTVGHLDVWADQATGLPLAVELTGRGATRPALTSAFLAIDMSRPGPAVTTPKLPTDARFISTSVPDVVAALDRFSPVFLPARLAGLPWRDSPTAARPVRPSRVGVSAYGAGFTSFVVLALPPDLANQAILAADDAGSPEVDVPGADALLVTTPLVNGLIMRVDGQLGAYLLAGTVTEDVLARAAAGIVRAHTGIGQ